MLNRLNNGKGLTLIELLILVSVLGIIISIVFLAFDPLGRSRKSRDAQRWADISGILSAIKNNQIKNNGLHIDSVSSTVAGDVYMITDGAVDTGCDSYNSFCKLPVTTNYNCLDLSELVENGDISTIPVSPKGKVSWSNQATGYLFHKDMSGVITISACESESIDSAWVAQ